MNQAIVRTLYAAAFCLLLPCLKAATVTVTWERNSEPDIAGYRVYYGPIGTKVQMKDVGASTSATLTDVVAGTPYAFYATAYNNDGLESAPSSQIDYTVPLSSPTSSDSDGDGLPDVYETANGLNPFYRGDASLDSDGDGTLNIEEYYAGTSPLSAGSALQIVGIFQLGNVTAVQFSSVLGRVYVLQANDDFPSGSWSAVSIPVSGTGSTIQVFDASGAGSSRRMFRVMTTAPNSATVTSDPAGFQALSFPGNSDTVASASLFRPAVFQGTVSSVSGSVLQVNGARWSNNQFAYSLGIQTNTYFVLLRGGMREGEIFTVLGNSASSLSLETYDALLDGLSPGDPISIIPFWTLGTIFPGGRGVLPSTSPAVRETEILLPDVSAAGINTAAAHTYYFWNGAWRCVGAGGAVRNDDVVLPDMYFWVRQNVSTTLELRLGGVALLAKWRVAVSRNPSAKQDNIFALPRPVPVSLNASGLISSGAFRSSPSVANRVDELLVFDNTSIGSNKAASATYYYWSGAWRKIGAGAADVGNDLILAPGSGFIIRSGPGSSAEWVNAAGY